jgi:fatty-acyl-CoA synthase
MAVIRPVDTIEDAVRPFGVNDRGVRFIDREGVAIRYTYDALARAAAGAAEGLHSRGVFAGDRVAVALDNSAPSVVAQMAVWMVGATLLSIPPPPRGDAGLYRQGFGGALSKAGCRLLVGSERVREALGAVAPAIDAGELVGKGSKTVATDVPAAEQPLIQFSSGSTGTPRGIALSSRALCGHVRALREVMQIDGLEDSAVSWLPLYHDMGFVGLWLSALFARGEVTIMAPSRFVRAPTEWLSLCAEGRATITVAPDFGYRLAARLLEAHSLEGNLSALRICLSGAERVSWATLEEFAKAGASVGFSWESLMPVYGMAEATLAVSCPPLGRGPQRDASGAVALGPPLPGIEVRQTSIDGGDYMLDLRGEWLFDGYLAEGKVSPALNSDGWFSTNDIGYIDDGELFVRGRADEAIIVRGRNVFAEDVESIAMMTASNEALGVAAFVPEDESGCFALAIELPPGNESNVAASDLKASVMRALEVKVSPVLVLAPFSIPRTTSGKVRRPACRAMLSGDTWRRDDQVLAKSA